MVHRCSLFRPIGEEVSSGDVAECSVAAVAKRAEGPARKIFAEMKLPNLNNRTSDRILILSTANYQLADQT